MATRALLDLPFIPMVSRHDTEPEPEPTGGPTTDPVEETPAVQAAPAKPASKAPAKSADPADPADDDPPLRPEGQRAIALEREKAKEATAAARQARADLEAANRKIAEFEDAKRSELEKAQAAAERATARELAANRRAVTSELRSAAITADSADAGLVVDLLSRNPDTYIVDGEVDTDAIVKDVEALLESKPILRKPAESGGAPAAKPRQKEAPRPDPAQGSRGSNAAPDWNDPAQYAAEAAKLGLRNYR